MYNIDVNFKYRLFEVIPFSNKNEERKERADLCVDELISRKAYDAIPACIAKGAPKDRDVETFLNAPAFSFLLDKCIETIPQVGKRCQFEGGHVVSNAYLLLEGLCKEYVDLFKLSHYSEKEREELQMTYRKLILTLSFAIRWGEKDDSSKVAEELMKLSEDSDVQFPFLVFSGYNEHAAHFCLEKEQLKLKSLTCFNKGIGNINHYQREMTTQSFFSKQLSDNISADDLLPLIEAKFESSIDFFYQAINSFPNSLPIPASLLAHDYSQSQLQGTCSAHALLAFLRYYLRKTHEGSDLHKQGLYKEHKARLMLRIFSPHVSMVASSISFLVNEKLELFRQDLALLKMAENQEDYEKILDESGIQLNLAQKLNSIHEKYAYLRKALKTKEVNLTSKIPFAALVRTKQERENNYLKKLLQECTDDEEKKELLGRIHSSGSRYIHVMDKIQK